MGRLSTITIIFKSETASTISKNMFRASLNNLILRNNIPGYNLRFWSQFTISGHKILSQATPRIMYDTLVGYNIHIV